MEREKLRSEIQRLDENRSYLASSNQEMVRNQRQLEEEIKRLQGEVEAHKEHLKSRNKEEVSLTMSSSGLQQC